VMLTTEAITTEIARVKYRADWSFEVYETEYEGPWLRIVAFVPDAYDPGNVLAIGVNSPIPPMRDTDAVHEWLIWRICRIESHEAREFYRVDSEVPFDPHREVVA
jgi:hypothetical protein